MLSRVAERIYWLSRYIERIENTARLAKVHSQLMFDLPRSVKLSWYTLVQITSNEAYFESNYDAKTEKNVMTMMLADRENSASLISSLWWARENIRTTRDSLPRDAWIYVNELYLIVRDNADDFSVRSKRNVLLTKIIRRCQAFNGMLYGTMNDNDAFHFIRLGVAMERADMTSRILDVGGFFAAQEEKSDEIIQYESILWANILHSIGVYFMYRQNCRKEINGDGVVDFLIHDRKVVRSLAYCVQTLEVVAGKLPNGKEVVKQAKRLQKTLSDDQIFEPGSPVLHEFLDKFQSELSKIHRECYDVWFHPS